MIQNFHTTLACCPAKLSTPLMLLDSGVVVSSSAPAPYCIYGLVRASLTPSQSLKCENSEDEDGVRNG